MKMHCLFIFSSIESSSTACLYPLKMLATLAGGFLPVILRQFMVPEQPEIDIGTVKFHAKLDEVIKNFRQRWPLYDLPFDVGSPDSASAETDGGETSAAAEVAERGRGQAMGSKCLQPGGDDRQRSRPAGNTGRDARSSTPHGVRCLDQSDHVSSRNDDVDSRRQADGNVVLVAYNAKPENLTAPAAATAVRIDQHSAANCSQRNWLTDRNVSTSDRRRTTPPQHLLFNNSAHSNYAEHLPLKTFESSTPSNAANNLDDSASTSVYFDTYDETALGAVLEEEEAKTVADETRVDIEETESAKNQVDWLIILP